MRMTVAVPVMNQLNETKGILSLLRYITSSDVDFIFVDNGSTDNYEDFILRYLKPKRMQYIRNDTNIGLVKTFQQIYEACETEVVAVTHNDLYIYEKDWDKRVLNYFATMPDLGAAGFFGSQGCGPIGERIQDVPRSNVCAGIGNMIEAEIHGMRMTEPWRPAAIFDGMMMIFRKEMLDKNGGFDQRYKFHHLYDRGYALDSLRAGYKNIVVNVPCHHVSGITANRPEYQTWIDTQIGTQNFTGDKWTHDHNTDLFKEKFKDALSLYVNDDFSYRVGNDGRWEFKGDAITKL